ncbi:cytochrome P450 [Nocardia blacklockiae]|uniref:cytochrome P450 n=1 Tax=Nocardia blacklockiae TaxID=480036 RepID=UPI0018942857|nr:cytochrome P450 [Nocardia blacklockiae]MBF6176016.1 cytochrome P450 [Nocardia blacklockiae]
MTTPEDQAAPPGSCPFRHGSPVDAADERIPLHDPAFAQNPHDAYRAMRVRFGSLAPVDLAPGVPATLVLGHRTAVKILHDEAHFPSDPRRWQRTVPPDTPLLAMMGYHPAARYTTGRAHERYREASRAAIDAVDLHALHDLVERVAVPLINAFFDAGRAEVISQYAHPLVVRVLNVLVGCPEEIGDEIAQGMAARFDSGGAAAVGMQILKKALTDLVVAKHSEPGRDMASIMLRHATGLTGDEVVAQLMSFYGAGVEALQNLIANTILLTLTDGRFGGGLLGGSLSTREALDEVLFTDPPMANFCTTYPRQPVLLDNVWLPAHQPVVVSLAACNTDPAIRAGDIVGNRSHLAWSAGPHLCPAQDVALRIAQDAIDQLLDALPDLQLAVAPDELRWRPGPFHRALTALPVCFTPASRPPTGLYAVGEFAGPAQ